MAKKNAKRFLMVTIVTLAVCALAVMGACSGDKSTYFVAGRWSAENVSIGGTQIDKITISVTDSYAEGDNIISSDGNTYGCYISICGEDVNVNSVNYISKYVRTADFDWNGIPFLFDIETKKDGQDTYIEGELRIFENHSVTESVTFTMAQES